MTRDLYRALLGAAWTGVAVGAITIMFGALRVGMAIVLVSGLVVAGLKWIN